MPPESDLIPYHAVAEIPARSVLVLAPHADDEVFGCGGSLAAHRSAGTPVRVVVLTDGAAYADPAQRVRESAAAADLIGYDAPEFWSYPDRGLQCNHDVVQRVVAALTACEADLLYAPSPWEVHPDHRQAAVIAAEAARATGVRVAYYEVGAPLRPNVLVDITARAELKARAMACFGSQLEHQDYAAQIGALNRYRCYTLPREIIAAEAFLVLAPADLDRELGCALAGTPVSLGAQPSAAAAESAWPLVSVLVRSLDREHLAEALDSVALQTYPNVEIVVIAARPEHRPLPRRWGRCPLRLVTTAVPLARSRAANRALDEAHGEFLLFLDDDDWLMPGHVARLCEVLRTQAHALAAYTGVALVSPDGASVGQVFDLPFDGVRQLAGNLTPIHAVLFRRRLLAAGCRFDEALDRYEDWDFWLQVARQAPMTHLPGVSAVYRIHQSSGVHEDAGPMSASTQVVYEKWRASWSAGQGAALMQRAWSAADLEVELASTRATVAQLQEVASAHARAINETTRRAAEQVHELTRQTQEQSRTIALQADAAAAQSQWAAELSRSVSELSQALARQERATEDQRFLAETRGQQIDNLFRSTSWRVTAPLRWVSSRLRRRP